MRQFLDRSRWACLERKIDSLDDWKRVAGVAPETKVFVCAGGYNDMRDALLRRGWVQNPDEASRHFDLKWARAALIDHDNLLTGQIVNHYDRCREITTKVGLSLNLREHW